MKIRVWLLTILSFISVTANTYAGGKAPPKPKIEKHNRVERVSPFGEIIVAKESLPDAVFEARRRLVQLYVVLYESGKTDTPLVVSAGTAFCVKPGYLLSSAHVLQEPIIQLIEKFQSSNSIQPTSPAAVQSFFPDHSTPDGDFRILLNDIRQKKTFGELMELLKVANGGKAIEYKIMARIPLRSTSLMVPLNLKAITPPDSAKDLMLMSVQDTIAMVQQSTNSPEALEILNPYSVFTVPFDIVDSAELGETVYPSGFGGFGVPFVFEALIIGNPSITDGTQMNGMQKPYLLLGPAEFGFSGGPTLTAEGKVLGVSKAKTDNMLLVVSKKDIQDFLKAAKI